MAENASLPLRRIVRAERILLSRSVATRPRIGRLASGSQALANSLGRPATMRRSMSAAAPVKYPSWLLPSLSGRSDELDPWRDRDLIAIRRARSRNRVVRTIPPRGLPMASHANGRGRLGEQVAPSSIARRLQPVRRAPSPNDAHVQATRQPVVRPATPRPPRSRRLALPPGKSGDRDAPAAELHPDTRPTGAVSSPGSQRLPLASIVHRQTTESDSVRRSFSDPMPKLPRTSASRVSSADPRSSQRTGVEPRVRRSTPRTTSESRTVSSRLSSTESTLRASATAKSSDGSPIDLSRPRPEWTTFGDADSPANVAILGAPSAPSPTLADDVRLDGGSLPRESGFVDSGSTSTRSPGVIHRSLVTRRSSMTADWRKVVGIRSRAESADVARDHRPATTRSTLAQRVAALADPSATPRSPGHLVRRSPVGGSLFSLAAAMAASHGSPTTNPRSVTPSPKITRDSSPTVGANRQSSERSRSSVRSENTNHRPSDLRPGPNQSAESARPTSVRRTTSSSRETITRSPRDLWRSTVSSPRSEARAVAGQRTNAVRSPNLSRPGDVARSRSLEGFSVSSIARRRHSTTTANAAVRRADSRLRLGAHPVADRVLRTQSRDTSSPSLLVPGGSASSPFVGVLARTLSARQVGTVSSRPKASAPTNERVRRERLTAPSSEVRTGPGREAAENFSDRLARRLSEDSSPGATSHNVARSGMLGHSEGSSHDSSEIGGLLARSMAARESTATGIPALNGVVPSSPSSTSGASLDSADPRRTPETSGRATRSTSRVPNGAVRRTTVGHEPAPFAASVGTNSAGTNSAGTARPREFVYRAATPPRPARIRRSLSFDDLPVAPIVVPPQREGEPSSPTRDSGETRTDPSRSGRTSADSVGRRRPGATELVAGIRSRRSLNIRRSTTSSSTSTGSPSDTVTADALARMIENGFEPDFTRTVTRRTEGTTSSPVRRTTSSNGSRTTSGSTLIRRSPSSELSRTSANPSSIIASAIGGSEASDGETGRVTTSQLLDLIDWINRVVEEKLRLELERRGMSGGRW